MWYRLLPVGIVIIEKKLTSVGEDVENLEALLTIGGNVKQCTCYGERYGK